jgi:hypothetical protein
MTIYILAMVACFAVALAILDNRNKALRRENERLKSEVSSRYRYCSRIESF